MKINTFFSVFTPKDTKFIPMLKELSSIIVAASTIQEEIFSLSDEKRRKELCLLVKAEELKGDKVSRQIFKALNETFITPFDREDIHELADTMDDVIDAMNRTAQKLLMYSPERLPEYTLQLSGIVKRSAEEFHQAVTGLSNIKKMDKNIRRHCKEVKKLEEEADTVYEEAITTLFHEDIKVVELIKLKEIIQELEKTVDKMDTSGKVVKTILVKYS